VIDVNAFYVVIEELRNKRHPNLPVVVYDSYAHENGTGTRVIESLSVHHGQLWINLGPMED
jgi:ABC-type thiamine transport system substrate-binding protein